MSKLLTIASSCLLLLAWPVMAPAGVEEGNVKRDKVPWSGYWWPHKQGAILKPLKKYDTYTGAQSAKWELSNHPSSRADEWHGYCHAWAASSLLETEPTIPLVLAPRNGGEPMPLTIGDQKGLLAVSHARDVANFYGTRSDTTDVKSSSYQDLLPDQLWRVLKNYVKQGKPIIMDLDAGPEVWNYPVYGYRVEYNKTSGAEFKGTITLWYADDSVPPSFVGTQVGIRRYLFKCQMRGGAIVPGTAEWIGASIKDHPDFAWSPYLVRPENPEIVHDKVLEMLKRGKPNGKPPDRIKPPDNPISIENHLVGPTDLLALLARPSDWAFSVHTDRFNGQYAVGEKCKIQVRSEKGGYLYLFHFTKEKKVRNGTPVVEDKITMIYPTAGDDNLIKGDEERKGPFEVTIKCGEPLGYHHIRAVVTSKPLRGFTGLVVDKKGKKREFNLNPTTKEMIVDGLQKVKVILENKEKKKRQRQEEAARFVSTHTGSSYSDAKAAKVLGKFAQSETTFYVGPAGKEGGKQRPPKKEKQSEGRSP